MISFLVLFDRDLHDEQVKSQDAALHFDQLKCEFELDTDFNHKMTYIGSIPTHDRMVLLVEIEFPVADHVELRDQLQKAYCDGGVDGFFNIVGTTTRALPLSP